MTEQPQHIEQEIAALEARLAEKRQALSGTQEQKPEKEIVREAVAERMISAKTPQFIAQPIMKQGQSTTKVPSKEELISISPDKQVAILVNIALEQSIDHAIEVVKSLNDPFVYDSLHDALTSMFFNELVKRKKIILE
ncbi:MAG: hypothetical protein A3B75_01160 [Candidatus Terrybacteria bacterium RIFCSPHIGHO2_02_FULL_43_14]|uniref:Uncharacterized protein n=1 Tax=Candidatus Terrybacteria bacterium RIFCSPHIGHO2_01_FULL_43_35 TaxID=1802361 RepID=A0A1G2PC36_9BACT|nr:MAG: hypothetical protein A2828_01380 [Candidatus Terrybacteria bacterium RIFCSPHIGHO2_01_FULL_43_35]OHA49681.1 MAG: hypothetical protein A3B75_01160 [Candidatus Terrybacteria bacterium RIFCSPHIGHO2_02_FULL_43_14]